MFASCSTGIVCQRAAEGKTVTNGKFGFNGSRGKLMRLISHIKESGCHSISVLESTASLKISMQWHNARTLIADDT
jgi:hypothetical protein